MMANVNEQLAAALGFQESLLRLTLGLQDDPTDADEQQNSIDELVQIARKVPN
jgi:hypothetical protein